MKSAKSLTSALHSFFLLSSLLFLTLSPFLLILNLPATLLPFQPPFAKNNNVSHAFQLAARLAFYPPHCPAPYSPHPLSIYLAYLLFRPYFSSSRSLLIFPQPSSTHLTGVWPFNIQSMPPSSEPSFSSAGFDRQVPPSPFPLPPRPYRSRRMREEDVGREEGETECPLRTAVAEQTDRWAKGCGGGGGGGGGSGP